MKKFINFIKIQMLTLSTCIFIAFTLVLIIISNSTHGKKYSYEMEGMFSIDIIFEDEDTATTELEYGNEFIDSTSSYKIKDNKLYEIVDEYNDEYEYETTYKYIGKITPYELNVENEELKINDFNLTLKCNKNIILKNLSIIFMSIFGVVTLGCTMVLILDKKRVFKYKKQEVEINNQQNDSNNQIEEN